MSTLDKIKKLGKALYPTGRAFKIPAGGVFDKLNSALSESEKRAYDDAVSILDSALPDNDNFTADDATQWERRLGLITNPDVPLADRKLAIIRKIRHPGNIPARQNYLYLQGQLQDAGFDVYVFENRFPTYPDGFETRNPLDVVALLGSELVLNGGFNGSANWTTQGAGTSIAGGKGVYNNAPRIPDNYIKQELDAIIPYNSGTYKVVIEVDGYVAGTIQLQFRGVADGGNVKTFDFTSSIDIEIDSSTFVGNNDAHFIRIASASPVNLTANIDNVSIKKILFDSLEDVPGVITVQHGDYQHGDVQHGTFYNNIIANFIDEDKDANFDTGPTLRSTFFVGANPIGEFADVLAAREDEFRQLILKIKPVSSIGFLFINFN